VTEDGQLMGIITDRDLTVRALAVGKNADTRVGEIVTRDPACCGADDDIRAVEKVMSERQVRRVPIVDGDGHCVGIVSQADLARAAMTGGTVSEHEVATVLESVSEPSR
jgi:CBS domain-containing protein